MVDASYSTLAQSGLSLGAGGLAPDTFVFTTEGAIPVAELTPGMEVYAIDPMTRLVKRKPLTAVDQVAFDGMLVTVETRRASFHVAPGQPILFRTDKDYRPRFQRAGDLNERYSYKFITDWKLPPREPLETIDITEFLDDYEVCAEFDEHGHTVRANLPDGCEPTRHTGHYGYYFDPATFKAHQSYIEAAATEVTVHSGPEHWLRPYRFDADDFIQLIGWFVTEGSIYRKKNRNTIEVQIAQKTEHHRDTIRALFDRLTITVTEKPDCFTFGSLLFGRLLGQLCGESSHSKHLPSFVWSLPQKQQELLFDVLIAGDGNEWGSYYTSSDQLATDVLKLSVELGMNPRSRCRHGSWEVRPSNVNDGFQSPVHVDSTPSESSVYQLTVADYPAILAGRDQRFQWIGVSNVS